MESWQREHITANLAILVENTICNTLLRSYLVSENILHRSDNEILEQLNGCDRNHKFYEIIQTRKLAFEATLYGLKRVCQTGVAEVLERGIPSCTINNSRISNGQESKPKTRGNNYDAEIIVRAEELPISSVNNNRNETLFKCCLSTQVGGIVSTREEICTASQLLNILDDLKQRLSQPKRVPENQSGYGVSENNQGNNGNKYSFKIHIFGGIVILSLVLLYVCKPSVLPNWITIIVENVCWSLKSLRMNVSIHREKSKGVLETCFKFCHFHLCSRVTLRTPKFINYFTGIAAARKDMDTNMYMCTCKS